MRTSTILKAVLLAFLISSPAFAMGDRPEPDPACFASDTLRVEIGGEKFAFPRKMVRSVRGADVVNPKDSRSDTISGRKACQKQGDKTWKVDYAALDILPDDCSLDDSQCREKRIFVQSSSTFNKDALQKYSKKNLLESCTAPLKPFSQWHSKAWSTCDYAFEDKGIIFVIAFRGGIYPPEQIEETQALIIKSLRQYLIK